MSLDPEPWAPPKSDLAPESRRGVGMTRAVVEGTVAVLGASVVVGLIFGFVVAFLIPDLRALPFREVILRLRGLPHIELLTSAARLTGLCVGGAVAARRHRGSPWASALGVGALYFSLWALPLIFPGSGTSASRGAGGQQLSLLLALPAALLGGALGRRRGE